VLPLVFLGLGFLCALISRALLTVAAFSISFGWGIGVFLPFGPLAFRLTYPDQSRGSRLFGVATLGCFFFFIATGGFSNQPNYRVDRFRKQPVAAPAAHYAIEKRSPQPIKAPAPTSPAGPSLEQRRAANAQEFEHLRTWNEQLRLRKRDLLHSDVEGNRNYVIDLALYNQELTRATAERNGLAAEK
jgi:hypothetical protein